MSNYVIRAKDHQEWLRARQDGIGSSEVATLLGVNPWQTPYQLWLAKTNRGGRIVEKESFLMKAGHYLEDAISRFAADDASLDIIKNSAEEFIVVNSEREYMRVSPDRYAWLSGEKHSKENKVIIECKSTQNKIDEEDIPKYWYCQVQYQMGVCELDRAVIAWLTQGREFGYKWLRFDKELFGIITEEVERFWMDNVLGGAEPALVDVTDVMTKYPKSNDGVVFADEAILDAYRELKETSDEIKRLEVVKKAAEDRIKIAMGEAERLVLPATQMTPQRTLATWKSSEGRMKFNEKVFGEDYPDIYKDYLVKTEGSRRFLLK